MKKSVITIKAWRRPEYFRKVIRSLEINREICNYRIIVSLDNWSRWTKWQHLWTIKNSKIRKRAEVYFHKNPLGCAGNMRFCFEKAFEELKYEYMIHLEDDTIVGRDFLRWMEWAYESLNRHNIFAACPFNAKDEPQKQKRDLDVAGSYLRNHFECQGGFGITRSTYTYIKNQGGIFGAVGDVEAERSPEEWKNNITITDKGSWAWPFNKYFINNNTCLYPLVSRSNNIGSKKGLFTPDEEWHSDHIFDDNWIEGDRFKDADLTNITYSEPFD